MVEKIKKRDGRILEFNIEKIAQAINKAFIASIRRDDFAYSMDLAKQVLIEMEEMDLEIPTVEQIQDVVEKVLIRNGHVRTARAYIVYRSERTRSREMKSNLMQIYEDLTFKDAKDSNIKRENANVNADTAMGTMLKYGSEGAKEFFEKFVLKPEFAKAHKEGDIHIHDLDFLTMTTTCCQIDLLDLFKDGFSTGHGVLREPNDIASYAALACIAVQSNQNDQHGGQSIVNFDYGMAPGVKKTYCRKYTANLQKALEMSCGSELTEEDLKAIRVQLEADGYHLGMSDFADYCKAEADILEKKGLDRKAIEKAQEFATAHSEKETDRATYQAMEAFIHNLNTMNSRAGAQTPFSSINYGMDTSAEGRMVMKNVLLANEAGLGNGETPIFPIQIFRVKEGISYNPGDPNYDLFQLACRVSAKRLFPNFSFVDAPFNKQYYKGTPETEIAYMGCRTRVIGNVHDKSREISNRRGNLSFTSINLPRIAIRAKGDVNWFFDELDKKIDLCIEQLLARFEIQASRRVRNFPFLMGQGVWLDSENLSIDDDLREVLKHGTLSVGFIGLAEALVALIGEHHGQSERAQNLGLDIISHMRARMDAQSEKTGMNFTLLATPAEGLSGRFVRMDKKRYGEIEGVTDRDYYTNSFHIPVYYNISAFDKIAKEGPYHALTNAGHISYVELDGDPTKNLKAFEKVIRAMHDAGIGYGSINHPVDRDPVCGYTGIIGDHCPKCGRAEGEDGIGFDRIRRITGYLVGTLDRFNDGKRAEERDRVKHGLNK
ncbi:MAG: anaerobic ribonucleoside triphosphate reductase [Ruminococcaceae bacterium]|nr:anaerobic ribonucleoside triphosphate reductase [Oscillospiraceae bacterium]